ncbi:MAG: hypothetical protein Q9171_001051 [Xanthocarpia ochracea]
MILDRAVLKTVPYEEQDKESPTPPNLRSSLPPRRGPTSSAPFRPADVDGAPNHAAARIAVCRKSDIQSTSSSNKAPRPSDAAYLDTLYGHGIVMDLSGGKIPQELVYLKERILQKLASPQLSNPVVDAVMDLAEDFAYNSKGPTNKILRTSMFPLDYGSLVKVEQNNVVNHPKARPYAQPAKRNAFPVLSVELKAESVGGVLTTAEAQVTGSGSHSVNSMRWLLEQAKAAGLAEIDLIQGYRDTVSFSVVASHRQAVAYLHWLDPEEKQVYMSYLRSYPTFEADSVRGCNNTIKNIIDKAEGPR